MCSFAIGQLVVNSTHTCPRDWKVHGTGPFYESARSCRLIPSSINGSLSFLDLLIPLSINSCLRFKGQCTCTLTSPNHLDFLNTFSTSRSDQSSQLCYCYRLLWPVEPICPPREGRARPLSRQHCPIEARQDLIQVYRWRQVGDLPVLSLWARRICTAL